MGSLESLLQTLARARAFGTEIYTEETLAAALGQSLLQAREDVGDSGPLELRALEYLRVILLRHAESLCSRCRRCSLAADRFSAPVFGELAPDSRVLLIGEGPGDYEERVLSPFVGPEELLSSRCLTQCSQARHCLRCFEPTLDHCVLDVDPPAEPLGPEKVQARSDWVRTRVAEDRDFLHTAGSLLNRCLRQAGFVRPNWNEPGPCVSMTNVVRCRATSPQGRNAMPEPEAAAHCGTWTTLIHAILNPRLVISAGVAAGRFLTGDTGFLMKQRAWTFATLPAWGEVLFIPHPAAALHARKVPTYEETCVRLLQKARERIETGD